MLLIREIMHCKPGKVRPMVEKFLAMSKLNALSLVAAAGALTAATVLTAGPTDPPAGPVAPTYKTLAEIDAMRRAGLRAILEHAMLDVMFEVPSQQTIREIIINEETIQRGQQPIMLFQKGAAAGAGEGAA